MTEQTIELLLGVGIAWGIGVLTFAYLQGWFRRKTKPAKDGAASCARIAPDEARHLTPEEGKAFDAALRQSVKVVARSITEAQVREIAEAWRELRQTYAGNWLDRTDAALRAAGIIGGDHD